MIKKITKLMVLPLLLTTSLLASSEAEVKAIVEKAVNLVKQDCDQALKKIAEKNGEFHNGSLYVFGYDADVVMVVHPVKAHLVGRSYKGKPDVKGKKFRDEIVSKGLAGGGWTSYSYQKPKTKGIHAKKSYSSAVMCNDKKIILAAGMYAK